MDLMKSFVLLLDVSGSPFLSALWLVTSRGNFPRHPKLPNFPPLSLCPLHSQRATTDARTRRRELTRSSLYVYTNPCTLPEPTSRDLEPSTVSSTSPPTTNDKLLPPQRKDKEQLRHIWNSWNGKACKLLDQVSLSLSLPSEAVPHKLNHFFCICLASLVRAVGISD